MRAAARPPARRLRLLAALAVPAALLAGCAQHSRHLHEEAWANHPIRVDRADREHRVPLREGAAPAGAWLAIAADHVRRGGGSEVRVRGHALDVRDASEALAAAGIPASALRPEPLRGARRGEVSVVFPVAEATPSPCGSFASDTREWHRWRNRPASEWGCATQHNLAVMLADPRDLERRRGSEGSYGAFPGRATGQVIQYGTYAPPPVPAATAGGSR